MNFSFLGNCWSWVKKCLWTQILYLGIFHPAWNVLVDYYQYFVLFKVKGKQLWSRFKFDTYLRLICIYKYINVFVVAKGKKFLFLIFSQKPITCFMEIINMAVISLLTPCKHINQINVNKLQINEIHFVYLC